MCNFYIGQKVVYIGTDRSFDPNPGKTIHTIQGIRKAVCKCDGLDIDVGKRTTGRPFDAIKCSACGCKFPEKTWVEWKCASVFRPLIEDYTEAEIESVNLDEVLEPLYEPA